MKYSVKNVKVREGRRGYEVSCSIYKDGKKIGTYYDQGIGGESEIEISNKKEKTEFLKIKDVECFIEELIEEFEMDKKIKNLCKKHTVLFINGEYTKLNIKYNSGYDPKIYAKFGECEIVNKRFLNN